MFNLLILIDIESYDHQKDIFFKIIAREDKNPEFSVLNLILKTSCILYTCMFIL